MLFLSLIPKLLIAGGSSFLGNLNLPAPQVISNYTLAGEKIPSTQVVCRDRWGTPMLPDIRAGFSLTAPINKSLIAQSLWVPPIQNERIGSIVSPVVTDKRDAAPVPSVPASAPSR